MTMYQRANRDGINEFLLGFDIDINRVSNENLDDTGYDYLSVDSVGRPVRDPSAKTHTIVRVRKEWPNAEVWPVLSLLLQGEELAKALDAALAKVATKQAAAPKKTEAK